MNKFKKVASIVLVFSFIIFNTASPLFVYANEGETSSNIEETATPTTDLTTDTDQVSQPLIDNDEDNAPQPLEETPTGTVSVTKVVCDSEADLPNWGDHYDSSNNPVNITAATANDWIENSDRKCHAEPGWMFEWAALDTANPGDNLEAGGPGWNAFGPTDLNGVATVTAPIDQLYWIREQLKPGYVPFSGDITDPRDQDVSAEIYCTIDVLNYDNFEKINPFFANGTHYCVAFNAPAEAPKQCNADEADIYMSNASTQVDGHDAALVDFIHTEWKASIPGAQWIWSQPNADSISVDETKVFTKDFTILGTPADSSITLAADNSYAVSMNGNPVPACSDETPGNSLGMSFGGAVTCAIPAAMLNTGPNQLSISVKNFAMSGSDYHVNPAGLLYKLTINDICGGEQPEPTNTSETIVVKTDDMKGWIFFPESGDLTQTGQMVVGPTGQPLGIGSAEFVLNANNQGEVLGAFDYAGTLFNKITSLAYSTFTITPGVALPALQFEFDTDRTDANNSYMGRLVYEPYYTHTVLQNTWQTWNPMDNSQSGGNGNWWFSNGVIATASGCSIATPCTWAQILAQYPNGGIRSNGPLSGLTLFKAGSGSAFTSNVDQFVIGVTTGLNTDTKTYDFEPTTTQAPNQFTLEITTNGDGNGLVAGVGIHCDSNPTAGEESGLNDCQETYDEGTVVNLTVTPDEGSNFNGTWSTNSGTPGTCTGNSTSCSVTMTGNVSLNAHFAANTNNTNVAGSSSFGGGHSSGLKTQGQVLGATTTCGIYVDKFLRKGHKNDIDAVKKVQQFLNDYMNASLTVDGKFDQKTEDALKAFQLAHADKILTPWGIKVPTGIFYLTTQTEVNNIMCPDLKLSIPSLSPYSGNPLAPKKED